ncbi:MAG: S-layer homology domain-containing protein [Oscillospiraceae bacterium]|jgi:hypothetical protein
MKRYKLTAVLLAVVCLLGLFPTLHAAASAETFQYTITADKQTDLKVGDTVTCTVSLKRTDLEQAYLMYGAQIAVEWDGSALALQSDSLSLYPAWNHGVAVVSGKTRLTMLFVDPQNQGISTDAAITVATFQLKITQKKDALEVGLKSPMVTDATAAFRTATASAPVSLAFQDEQPNPTPTNSGNPVVQYQITVNAGTGGEVNPGTTTVGAGDTQTFTITPHKGYEVADVVLDGVSQGKTSSITLDNIQKNHTLTVTFQKISPVDVWPFEDVASSDWFYPYVKDIYEKGMMVGTSATRFSPQMETTRAMLVTILYRASGSPQVTKTNHFSDVESGTWYTDAVIWAATEGIVKGYTGGLTFGPNDAVTREQVATILKRFAEYQGHDTSARENLTTFPDGEQVADWAHDSVAWAVGEQLLNGTGTGHLKPQGTASRAETATVLSRFFNVL